MAHIARVSAAFLSLFVGTITQANAFCLNDEELRDVLLGAYVYSIGQTLGVCSRKYPSLKSKLLDAEGKFEKAYSAELQQVDRRSIAAFERNYPGRGIQARDNNDAGANRQGLAKAEQFSLRECENVAKGVQASIDAEDWALFVSTSPAVLFFRDERSRVPRCSK